MNDATYTMMGPCLGTFSPPTTRISVKNEVTAQLATVRTMRCTIFGSEAAIVSR